MTRYWHGGGRNPGEWLLPSTETGNERSGPGDGWVYVTPNRALAVNYSASTDSPWVYEVQPLGELEQDPESHLEPGQSMRCRKARILRRERPSANEVQRARSSLLVADRMLSLRDLL